MMIWRNFYLWLWLCISVSLSYSSKAVDCSADTIGLCTPTIEKIIDEVITETIEFENGGINTTTVTETTTTTLRVFSCKQPKKIEMEEYIPLKFS